MLYNKGFDLSCLPFSDKNGNFTILFDKLVGREAGHGRKIGNAVLLCLFRNCEKVPVASNRPTVNGLGIAVVKLHPAFPFRPLIDPFDDDLDEYIGGFIFPGALTNSLILPEQFGAG